MLVEDDEVAVGDVEAGKVVDGGLGVLRDVVLDPVVSQVLLGGFLGFWFWGGLVRSKDSFKWFK